MFTEMLYTGHWPERPSYCPNQTILYKYEIQTRTKGKWGCDRGRGGLLCRPSYCCRFGTRRPCSIIVIIGERGGGDFYTLGLPLPTCVTTGRLTPVRSTRYSERAPSKQYDRRVSRSLVECAPIILLHIPVYWHSLGLKHC